jgi:hypothetical protein
MKTVRFKENLLITLTGQFLECPIKSLNSYCGSWCAFFDTEVVAGYCGKPSETRVTCRGRSIGILEEDK